MHEVTCEIPLSSSPKGAGCPISDVCNDGVLVWGTGGAGLEAGDGSVDGGANDGSGGDGEKVDDREMATSEGLPGGLSYPLCDVAVDASLVSPVPFSPEAVPEPLSPVCPINLVIPMGSSPTSAVMPTSALCDKGETPVSYVSGTYHLVLAHGARGENMN